MRSIFKFEWHRMIHSKTLLISLIAASFMVVADVYYWYDLYRDGIDTATSVLYKWLGVNRGMSAGIYFFMALPMLTAFAYSWTVSSDRRSGYISQIVTKVGRRKYFVAKFLVTFISGGLVFDAALVLDYMLLSLFSPAYMPVPGDLMSSMDPFRFGSVLFYQYPYLFILVWMCVAFLWGGTMASIGTAAGMLTKKSVVASVIPLLVFTGEQILANYLSEKYRVTIRENAINLGWTDMFYAAPMSTSLPEHIFGSIALITGVSLLIYALRGRKYECL